MNIYGGELKFNNISGYNIYANTNNISTEIHMLAEIILIGDHNR